MIELYHAPSTASFLPHWLLIELSVPHTLRPLNLASGEHKQPAYLQLNPAGVVPTLVVDGRAITEAAAIALYLADAYPQAKLAPPAGGLARASYYQWMMFCANTLQPKYRAWFYPDEPAGPEHVDAVKHHALLAIERAWAQVNDHLASHGPYLLGAEPTASDFMLTMMMRWSRKMPQCADTWPANAEHARRMKQRPSFKEAYARENLTDWT